MVWELCNEGLKIVTFSDKRKLRQFCTTGNVEVLQG